ncbi:MAG: hypothetical protein WDN01_08130 [Rhizomicrobium sp.]
MSRAAAFLATLLLSGVLPCAAEFASTADDAGDRALCDRVAARIRGQPHADGKTDDPFAFATAGSHPWIEAPEPVAETAGDSADDWAAYRATLASRFHPDAKLARAFADYVPEDPQLASLPGSPVHALIATGGTMHCQTFIFFTAGTSSRMLPELARGENNGAFCWQEAGGLARVNGHAAFLYRYFGITDFEYQLGVVPLEGDRWGEGCRVDAKFQTLYAAGDVSAPPGSASGALEAAALALARAGQFGTGQYVAFSPVPAAQRESWNRLLADARTAVDLDFHEPSYGPLVLGGKVYFAVAARQGVGWREGADVQVDLYALIGTQVQKVGSAGLSASRGRLLSAQVLPGGVQP